MKIQNSTVFILKALYLFTFFRTSSMENKMFTDFHSIKLLNYSNKKVSDQCSPLIYSKIEEFPLLSKDNDEEKKLITEMKIQLFKDVEKIIFLLANFDQKTFKSFQNTSQNDIDIDQVSSSHKFLSVQNIIQSHLLIQNVYGVYENTSISYNSLIDKQITMIAQNFYNLSTILSATDNAPTTGDFGRYLLLQKQGAAFNYKALLIINSFLYKNPQVNNFKNKYKNLFVTLYKTQYVFDKMQNQNKLFSQEFLKIIKKKRITTMSLLDKYSIDKILEKIEEDVKKKCIFISLKKKKISQKIPTNIDKIFHQLDNVILEEDIVQVLDNYKFICEVQEVTNIYQNIIDTQKVKQNNKDLVDNVETISKQINLDNIKTKLEEIYNYLNNKGICNFEKVIVNHSIYSCINNNICDKDNLYWQCNMVMSVLNIYRLFFQEVSSLCEKGYPCLSMMLKQYRVELDPLQNVAGIISMYSKCSTFYQSMVEIYNMTYGDLNKIEHFQSFLKQNKISTVLDLNNFLLKHVTATYCQKELLMLKGIMKENMSSAYQYTHVMELDLLKNFLLIYTEIFNLNNEKNIANDEDILITQLKLGEINVIKEPETSALESMLYEKQLHDIVIKSEEAIDNIMQNQYIEKETIDNYVGNKDIKQEYRENDLLSLQKQEESILDDIKITEGLLNASDLRTIDKEDRLLISKLQKENTELKQSLQILEEDYDILVNKESDLRQNLMEQIEKNETYKEEVRKLKDELNYMNQTKGKKKRCKEQSESSFTENIEYNKLLIKYNELFDKHNKVLGTFQHVQILQKKYDELQNNSELENKKIIEMEEENQQISLLREENLELKRVIDLFAKDGENNKLIAELRELQKDNQLLTKENEEITLRYHKIRKNIDNLNTEKQTIANEKQKLHKTVNQSRDVQYMKTLEYNMEELEGKFKEISKENDELLNEFKKLQESLYTSESMKDVLSTQNQDLHNHNNRLTIENNKLKKNNEFLQKQNEFLQQKNKQ